MNKQTPLFRVVLWLLTALLVAWAARQTSLTAVWRILRTVSVSQLFLWIGLNLLIIGTLVGRWWLILHGMGKAVPFWQMLAYRQAGFAVSLFTPGPQFGGEPVQVLLLTRRHGLPARVAIAGVTVDRLLELVVNLAFLAGGLWLVLDGGLLGNLGGWKTAVFSLLPLTFPLFYLIGLGANHQPITRLLLPFKRWLPVTWLRVIMQAEREASLFCRQQPMYFAGAVSASLIAWGCIVAEFGLLFHMLGATLSPVAVVSLLVVMRVALLLPLPGGLGSVEAGLVWAMSMLGGETAVVLSALLLFRLRDLISGGIGLWLVNRLLLFPAKSFTLSPSGSSSPGPVLPTLHKHEEEEI
ncbi:MAG: UPF0104 family protein [Chloroflexi bacterium]|nr:MAG: UPF0104 family protein [Chloroflexota bacterium]